MKPTIEQAAKAFDLQTLAHAMRFLLIPVVLLSSIWVTNVAHAVVYKCVSAEGAISYTSTECPIDEATAKILKIDTKRRSSSRRHSQGNYNGNSTAGREDGGQL